jgi:hypothetical protein
MLLSRRTNAIPKQQRTLNAILSCIRSNLQTFSSHLFGVSCPNVPMISDIHLGLRKPSLFFVFSSQNNSRSVLQLLLQEFVHGKCNGLTRRNTHHSWCDALVKSVETFLSATKSVSIHHVSEVEGILLEHVLGNNYNATQSRLSW